MNTYKPRTTTLILIAVALHLVACEANEATHTKVEPAKVEHEEGSESSRLTLTEEAAKRVQVQTAPVTEEMIEHSPAQLRKVVPYSAVLYDIEGKSWLYTSTGPLTFIRQEIVIDFIEGDKAVLTEGPPTGTQVVTRGAAELLGTEFAVGH